MKRKPLVLVDGKVGQLDVLEDEILGAPDHHSGFISISKEVIIDENKQMINFTMLKIDDVLILDGDLWLA